MNKIGRMFRGPAISSSALAAQRRRLDAVSENLANVNTTRTSSGGPYRRKIAVFSEVQRAAQANMEGTPTPKDNLNMNMTRGAHIGERSAGGRSGKLSGVHATIVEDSSDPRVEYDPSHPDADENGYVEYPNINVVSEMVELMSATRAYEANLSAIKAFKEMARKALEL